MAADVASKLVFVLPGLGGGGAEKVVLNLYNAMEQFKGHECHILSLSRNVTHAVGPHMRVHYLDEASTVSKKGVNRLTYKKKIAQIVDNYIDQAIGRDCIVFSNMMFADKVMSLSRHRIIHIIHNAYSESLLGGKPSYRSFFIKRNINKVYSRHPMVFVAQGALDSFTASFGTDVPKYVIHNPIGETDVRRMAESEPIERDYNFIVHVGRFNRQKRHDRLLKAFARIRPDVKLLLLGEGRLENKIRSLVDELQLGERVVFCGFRKNPYPLMKAARMLVLSSDFEGLPTVILEAMTLGTPIVTTDCPGGIREIFSGTSPCLVPLDDIDRLAACMEDALSNPDKYTTALDAKFSTEFAAEQYDRLVKGTLPAIVTR